MNDEVTWYAIYEVTDENGHFDSDFTPCESKEAAIEEATTYLEFANGEDDAAYAVAVPNSICTDTDENWTLWEHLWKITNAADFVWLHRGSEYAKDSGGYGIDIVDELNSLVDGQDDDLGMLLQRAAAEIKRLRALNK